MTGSRGIWWLASYPKSGNTWMRVLLANYLAASDEPADINQLEGGPIASARGLFDDHVGIESSDLTQDEIERYRGPAYEAFVASRRPEDGPLFCKVHDAWTLAPDGGPLFTEAATAGVIYLVRNPLDVAVSYAHHSARTHEWAVAALADPEHCLVRGGQRLHHQLRQRLLTWSGHVESWVDHSGLPVLTVRYEDTSVDAAGSLRQVLEFAGITVEDDRIARAVEFSRFERLQAREREVGFREKMPKSEQFFRRGQAGGWKDELASELAARVIATQRTMMQRLGYLDDE